MFENNDYEDVEYFDEDTDEPDGADAVEHAIERARENAIDNGIFD